MLLDPEQKIARPRQVYLGPEQRSYVPIEERAPQFARGQGAGSL
jgi:citrate synthase